MATYVWTGKVNNLFNNPKNWSVGGQEAQSIPSAGDAIQIPGGLADEESSNSVASAVVAGTVVTNGSAGAFGVITAAGILTLSSGASDYGQIFIQGGVGNITGNVDVEGIGTNLSTGVFCVAGGTLNMQGQLTVATTSGKDGLFLVDGGGQATIQGGDASNPAVVVSVANTAGEVQVSTGGKLTVIGGLYLGPSNTQFDTAYLYIVQGGNVDVSRPAAPDKDLDAAVNAGTQATIQVSGANSVLTSEQAAIIGDAGNAQLTIDTGGKVQAKGNLTAGHQSSGSAAISVSGSGSILVASGGFVLGDAGAAQLNVNSGGKVQADNDLTAGNQAHASGGIILTGSGSSLNVNGDLVLGKDGEGDLTMSDNANLTVSGTWRGGVDAKSTSIANLGNSATVAIDGDMLIGVSGTQTVNVTTGAHITVSGNANIGQQPTSGSTSGSTGSGALSVDGTGSLFEAGYMTIAGVTVPANNKNGEPNGTSGRWDYSSGGSGSLTVSSGGHVAVDHTLTLNDDPNSTSAAPSITVNSGGLIEVGGNGASPASNLFMQIDNGGLVVGHGAIVAITPASGTTPAMLGDIINNATGSGGFEAKEGTLVIDGNVTGGGNIHIDQSSTVELGGSFGTAGHSGGTVVLENTDAHTLILDDPANFHGTITGLDIGDRIILRNTNLATGNAVVDATIGDLNGVQTLGIQEGTDSNHTITFPDGTTSLRFTIQGVGGNPIPVATNPGTGTTPEFFNVTQSADGDTILTLQEGNPVDLAVNAPAARQTYGVTGAGITVGVISDSFDALGGEGNDLAMGALPANVNAVDLIGGTDEGRAMAQIVHDIAPGAAISAALNVASGLTINSPLEISSVTSEQTGEVQTGQSVQLILTLNEAVTVNAAGGAPTLDLSNGSTATYNANESHPSAGQLVFDYKVGASDAAPDLSVIDISLPTGTTVRDVNANNADFSNSENQKIQLQIQPEFVDAFYTSPTQTARAGDMVQLKLQMSGGVIIAVTGNAPTLTLSDGATATYDAVNSNPSSGLLVFDYLVGNEQTPRLQVTGVNLNGDTIKDANGVSVDFSGALVFPTNLTINSPLIVSAITASQTGQSTQLTLDMSESFVVNAIDTGSPTLSLSDGTTATLDANASNFSAGMLVFDDTLAQGEQAANLHITAVNLNGTVIQDTNSNNADLLPLPRLRVSNDPNAQRRQQIALSTLVTVSDPFNFGYQTLELRDSNGTVSGGQFVVNGVAQTGGHEIDVMPADAANNKVVFDVGTAGGTDTLYARLLQNNGQLAGWQSFMVIAPAAPPPVLSVNSDSNATHGQTIALSILVTVSDPDLVGFQKLELWDSNGTLSGGQFVVNGTPQTGGHEIDVAPANLAGTVFNVGTLGGTDTLYAQLLQNNGQVSGWQSFTVTAPVARLPTLTVTSDGNAARGQTVALSTLVSISDPDQVGFQKLELWDSNGTVSGGQLVVNEVAQTGGHEIDVAPADMTKTVFDVGTLGGTDMLWAQLLQSNGQVTGWQPFSVPVPLPALTVTNDPNAARGQSLALSTLVSVSDPAQIGFQKLELWDSNGTVGGGQFFINNVAQTGAHEIDVAPADVTSNKVVFKVGTLTGTDMLWAQLLQNNGQVTGWQPFSVTVPLPSLTVTSDPNAARGQSVALSTLVTVSDPAQFGFQKLELWDSNGTVGGGQFFINNVAQTGGHEIDVAPADMTKTVFNAGAVAGTDTLWAQLLQNNGQVTGWQPFSVTVPLPSLTVTSDPNAARGQLVALSTLVTVSDPAQFGFQRLELWDSNGTVAGGQFVVNGTPQTGGHEIDVAPANLINTVFNVGTLGGTDMLWAQLQENNGQLTGWQSFTVTAPPARLATLIVTSDGNATRGQTVALSTLVSVSDPDLVGYQKLELWDSNGTVGGGQFVVNGAAQTGGHEIDVAPSNVSSAVFDVGTAGGTDTLWAQLLQDNGQLSGWEQFTVTAPVARVPTLTVSNDPNATRGHTVALSLLVSIADPDSAGYQKLELWDSNGTAGGGQFAVNGVAQTGGHEIDVSSANVANTVFDVGTLGGTDTLWAQLLQNNGQATGWEQFTVTAPPDQPPTVTAANIAATTRQQTFAASSLFTASDPDGDTISKYGLWDTGAGGGYFLLNGVPQATKQEIDVTAAQLAQTTYQSGLGTDTLSVRAYDGAQWSSWSNFTVTAPPFFTVFLNDPQHLPQDTALLADLKAAAADWAQYFNALGTVEIQLNVKTISSGRADGGPANTAPVGTDGTRTVYESGAEYEMLHGTEYGGGVAGSQPDITIDVDPTYLQNDLWLDPNPTQPSPIPSNLFDAVTELRHEIGHGLGILSFRDINTGALPATSETVWDKFLQIDPNGSAWFTGPTAEAIYGGRVPVTTVNDGEQYSHLANSVSDGDGQDVMNGIEIDAGRSYPISSLDLAILKDLGLPVTTTTVSTSASLATVGTASSGSGSATASTTAGIPDTALLGNFMASAFASNALDSAGSVAGNSASAPPQQELLTQPHQA